MASLYAGRIRLHRNGSRRDCDHPTGHCGCPFSGRQGHPRNVCADWKCGLKQRRIGRDPFCGADSEGDDGLVGVIFRANQVNRLGPETRGGDDPLPHGNIHDLRKNEVSLGGVLEEQRAVAADSKILMRV